MIILEELEKRTTDALFEHTRLRRQRAAHAASSSRSVNNNSRESQAPVTAANETSEDISSEAIPDVMYSGFHRKDLDIETLEHYGLTWEWDPVSPVALIDEELIKVLTLW